jgi:electron transport complex protein RnfC
VNFINYIRTKGAKIPAHKEMTKDLMVENLQPPEYLYYPMAMHIGKPAKPSVAVGDRVKIGTCLGEIEGGISSNIHASVSGKVIAIDDKESFRGRCDAIVIENDYKDEILKLEPLEGNISPETFKKRLEDAGVTGKGGAGFPAHVKYDMTRHESKYLLINGAECEPYSTVDHRCMVEFSDEIIEITALIMAIYQVNKAYIAVEDHMEESLDALNRAIEKSGNENIIIYKLPSLYPQGHSGLQIEQVLGIEISDGERSGDVGVLQSNVSTIKAIYDAVIKNTPFYKRIITVTGPMIKNPKNLMVRIGTSVENLISACGGLKDEEAILINGGPMMGKYFEDKKFSVEKDTTTILFLKNQAKKKEGPCIRCARCINQCPVSLQPILISNAYRNRAYEQGYSLKSQTCINCGTCSYICPSKINLLEDIQNFNKALEDM